MKNKTSITRNILTAALWLSVGASLPFLLSNQRLSDKELPQSQVAALAVVPEVPAEVHFADETIRLDRADLRERMDREITAFTYSHQTTLLMLKRANRYFPIVEPILKECGVPDDLKYLMVIESNLSPTAKSPAGAAGLWQFMQATGREYGLEVNTNIDERYNVEKATRAACEYLKKAYALYGNWMTVAASYNGGQSGISRRLEQQSATTAMDLWLVEETSRYMFRMLTAKLIFSDPARYGFLLKSSDLYPPIAMSDTLEVDDALINFTEIAKKNGLNYMQLRDANPWIRSTSTKNPGRKKYRIYIPDKASLHYDPAKTKAHSSAWVVK